MANIPSDNHIRNLLDPVPPQAVFPVFSMTVNALHEVGLLEAYRSFNGDLAMALDGTQYFSSKNIHCDQCSTAEHNGVVTTTAHLALMCSLFIIVHQPLVQIFLQAFQISIQMLSERDLVELLKNGLVKAFTDAVCLR